MVEVLAVDLLGLGAPGRAPGRCQLIGSGMPTPAAAMWPPLTKPRRGVVLVELERASADIAAAGPGVDRVVEEADRGAVLVEGDVAADEVAAVGEAVREAAGLGEEQQPRGLDGAAGEDEQVGLLLDEVAVGILVDRGLDPALSRRAQARGHSSRAGGRNGRSRPHPGRTR